ncbi:MAG TPA: hypothetical protein VMH02_04250 [Verrucomicrobiae bacterium]|nr:hypothetical protein [Verrucomicrobiae bacterium]
MLYGVRYRLPVLAGRPGFIAAAVLAVAVSALLPSPAVCASVEPITVGGMTVSVAPVPGKEAVQIEGKGPAMAPVTVRLYGTISRDLPNVFLNRRDILADAGGHFSAVVPIGPLYWRGTTLTVTVDSPDATATASAHMTVVIPNPEYGLPGDQLPDH